MTNYPPVINYLIALVAISFALYIVVQKSKGRPAMKIYGLTANAIIKLLFLLIGIVLALIILTLLN